MAREIDDKAYIQYLPSKLYQNRYFRWRKIMLTCIEDIVKDLEEKSLSEVMTARSLTPKDIALLVRLNYVTSEEAERFGMLEIERVVPL